MQVFLVYPAVKRSFKALDKRRLNKQTVELAGLLHIAQRIQAGERGSHWVAVNLFRDHYPFLCYCFLQCKSAAEEAGIVYKAFTELTEHCDTVTMQHNTELPKWFGRKAFHSAHRQALLAKSLTRKLNAEIVATPKEYESAVKEYEWYRGFGWREDANTTAYHYMWWNPKSQHLYAGPEYDAMRKD